MFGYVVIIVGSSRNGCIWFNLEMFLQEVRILLQELNKLKCFRGMVLILVFYFIFVPPLRGNRQRRGATRERSVASSGRLIACTNLTQVGEVAVAFPPTFFFPRALFKLS